MKALLLVPLATLMGCSKTRGPAPGQPEGEAVAVTYYYLNF